jgi:hypothetical protein
MKLIAKSVFLFFLLVLLTAFVLSITTGYQSSLHFLVSFFQEYSEKINNSLTPGKFKLLQRFVFAVILILAGIFYYFDDLYRSMLLYIRKLFKRSV